MPLDSNVSNDTIAECMREYSRQKRKCAEEQGLLRTIIKRAKSQGVNVAAMTATEKASKLEPEDVIRDLSDQIRYMSLRRIEVTQADLFDSWDTSVTQKTAADDQTWEAEDAGYQAGRHGATTDDSPFPPGSELAVRWLEHWHKGQASIAREMGPDAVAASTSRERPARGAAANDEAGAEADAPPVKRGPGRPRKTNGAAASGGRSRRSQGNGDSAPAA